MFFCRYYYLLLRDIERVAQVRISNIQLTSMLFLRRARSASNQLIFEI